MSALVSDWALAMVRTWTRLYTAGARHEARDARRAQVESDLWEHRADATASGIGAGAVAREVTSRMVRSIPADLAWRVGNGLEVPQMFWIERSAGVFLMLVVALFFGALGGPGITGDEPYFTEDFPTFADEGSSVVRAIAFRFAVGAATIVTAALLFQTFRRESPRIAAISAGTLLVGAGLFVVSAVALLDLHGIAQDWRDEGRVVGGAAWEQARDRASLQESTGFLGVLAVAAAFAGFGTIIARSAILPRALAWPALAGGALLVGSLPLWSVGDWGWFVSMLGMMSMGVSFLLTAGWLALRGTRPAARA